MVSIWKVFVTSISQKRVGKIMPQCNLKVFPFILYCNYDNKTYVSYSLYNTVIIKHCYNDLSLKLYDIFIPYGKEYF